MCSDSSSHEAKDEFYHSQVCSTDAAVASDFNAQLECLVETERRPIRLTDLTVNDNRLTQV